MLLGPLWIIHMEEDAQGIRLVWIFYIEIHMFNIQFFSVVCNV
jgi:hypothetical protein